MMLLLLYGAISFLKKKCLLKIRIVLSEKNGLLLLNIHSTIAGILEKLFFVRLKKYGTELS